eukprot:gene22066-28161_t
MSWKSQDRCQYLLLKETVSSLINDLQAQVHRFDLVEVLLRPEMVFRKIGGEADFGRVSVETLGSTGFMGLLAPELRLDGGRQKSEEDEEKAKQPVTTEGLTDIHANLAELMKSMAEGQLKSSKEHAYFPEGVAHTIPQVAIKLDADMLEFRSHFPHHAEEDRQEALLKKRDKEMLEKGRQEQRDKQLLDVLGGDIDSNYQNLSYHHQLPLEHHPRLVRAFQSGAGLRGQQYQMPREEDAFVMRNHSNVSRPRAQPPLSVSVESLRESDGPESSPFQMLSGKHAPRDAFPVDNRQKTDGGIASSIERASEQPYSAQDDLNAQQMRELIARINERSGELLQMQGDILDEQPRARATQSDPRVLSQRSSGVPVFHHPVYGPLVPANSGRGMNPFAPPNRLPAQMNSTQRGHPNGLIDVLFDEDAWQPAPPVEHKSLSTASKGIVAGLRAMETTLNARLPPDLSSMSLADRIRATMEKDAAAAGATGATAAPALPSTAVSPVKSRFAGKLSAPASTSVSVDAKPAAATTAVLSSVSVEKDVAVKLATSMVNAILPSSASIAKEDSKPPPPVDKSETVSTAPPVVTSKADPSPVKTPSAPPVPTKTATPTTTTTASDAPEVIAPAVAIDPNKKLVNKNTYGLKPPVGASKAAAIPPHTSITPKSNIQVLSEMDGILGIDNYRRVWGSSSAEAATKRPVTTLGLGQFVPPANPAAAKEIMRVAGSAVAPSKPSLTAQIPLPWETQSHPSHHPSSVDLRTLHGLKSTADRPRIVIQAPSDEQLMLRQHQQYNHHGGANLASAPPSHMDHSSYYSSPPLDPPFFDSHTSQFAAPPQQGFPPFSSLQDAAQVIRPPEGYAMEHLRSSRQQQEEQRAFNSPQYLKPASHQYSVFAGDGERSSPVSIAAVSLSGASLNEREAHLQRMRHMRQAITSSF